MNDLSAQVAELKTEVRYLKWIIPAACGFVALVVLVFWNIERNHIGAKVTAAMKDAGVLAALKTAEDAALEAQINAGLAKTSAKDSLTSAESVTKLERQVTQEADAIRSRIFAIVDDRIDQNLQNVPSFKEFASKTRTELDSLKEKRCYLTAQGFGHEWGACPYGGKYSGGVALDVEVAGINEENDWTVSKGRIWMCCLL